MNSVLEFVERIAIGAEVDVFDQPVLDFRCGHVLTKRDLMEAVLVLASVGKGKSTLGKTIALAMLGEYFGGLVLAVKRSQIADFVEVARRAGREDDCFVLAPGSGHIFNPLQGETSISEATALVAELAEVLAGKFREGGENDSFWRDQLTIILKNLFTLCRVVAGRFDLLVAARLFDGRANSLSELADPSWQQSSTMAAALALARKIQNNTDVSLAVEYFSRSFPSHGDRLQGSLAATVSGVFDTLRRAPLKDLFCGRSTFDMDDLLNRGKICIVGLPALDSGDGRIANAVLQFCFCRAATRIERENFAFLFSDECQETVSRELMQKLAVLREFKIASVLLTQNLAVLDEKIGQTAREGLLGLMGTKIFGPQGHAATRQWAADQIGKRKYLRTSTTTANSHGEKSSRSNSKSYHEVWDYRVPPSDFAELKVGHTIVLRDGAAWHARWHKDRPGWSGTVRIAG